MPDCIDDNGYSFPHMGTKRYYRIDMCDTHPGKQTFVMIGNDDEIIFPYAGWQSGPVANMIAHGHKFIQGNMLRVVPIHNFETSQEVDSGGVYAMGEGFNRNEHRSPGAVQGALKYTDDMPLIAVNHLLRLISGVSVKDGLVTLNVYNEEYPEESVNGDYTQIVSQKRVNVAGTEMSGKCAFGRNWKKDLRFVVNKLA